MNRGDKPMMNAAIYVRVSTDQQAEKGYSIDTQLAACRKYALELGATNMEDFIDDGYSGEFIDRPALSGLRAALADKRIDAVIAYAPDRLARKTIHLLILSEEIAKAGAIRRFASVNFEETSEGELMYKFQGIVAEYEKEKIKERTMRGKRGKAAKGLVISDAKPLGYRFDREKSTYIINEKEAALVRMIFHFLVNEKKGTARICKELNARGIPSPRAKSWVVSSVHRILTNTLYKGTIYSMKYRYEKIGLNKKKRTLRPQSEWIPIQVPAIVNEETWQAAQRCLQENKNLAKRNLKKEYLLNGLITCAQCGKAMVISYSGSENRISYYACLSKRSTAYRYSGRTPCANRQIPTQTLDESIFNYLLKLYCNPDNVLEHIPSSPKNNLHKFQTALAEMHNAEQELLRQRDAVLRWFRQKILSEPEGERQLQDINRQLSNIAQLKKNYETELAVIAPIQAITEMENTIKLYLQQGNFTITEKRNAVRALLDKVIVERVDHTRGRGSCPEINVWLKLK
jgi:site-specific DNA recombinase